MTNDNNNFSMINTSFAVKFGQKKNTHDNVSARIVIYLISFTVLRSTLSGENYKLLDQPK